jgi:hypothetical protein
MSISESAMESNELWLVFLALRSISSEAPWPESASRMAESYGEPAASVVETGATEEVGGNSQAGIEGIVDD